MTITMNKFLNEVFRYAAHTFSVAYAKGTNYVLMRAWGEEHGLSEYFELAHKWYGITITCTELSSGIVYRAEGDLWTVVFNFQRVE